MKRPLIALSAAVIAALSVAVFLVGGPIQSIMGDAAAADEAGIDRERGASGTSARGKSGVPGKSGTSTRHETGRSTGSNSQSMSSDKPAGGGKLRLGWLGGDDEARDGPEGGPVIGSRDESRALAPGATIRVTNAGLAPRGATAGQTPEPGQPGSHAANGDGTNDGTNGNAPLDGRAASCDNGVLEPNEACDVPFSENCGSDCTFISSPTCQLCTAAKCAGAESCAGLAGGAPDEELCNAVLDCVRKSGCSSGGFPLFCYCGAVTTTDCEQGGATGACKELIEDGLNSVDPKFIQDNFGDIAFPAGRALARIECELSSCREDIKPSCP
ncbi:MAG TPA: hypothetical protein VJN18_24930 [Polyangiaceae bacterium]|nr:hypothetical protein [Polyangiaceae bacterium]